MNEEREVDGVAEEEDGGVVVDPVPVACSFMSASVHGASPGKTHPRQCRT